MNHQNEGTHPVIDFYNFFDRSSALKRCDDVAPLDDDMATLMTLKC